eukprot:SAG25_NODE_510_length_7299_cov_4.456667_1_plen_492_part_10
MGGQGTPDGAVLFRTPSKEDILATAADAVTIGRDGFFTLRRQQAVAHAGSTTTFAAAIRTGTTMPNNGTGASISFNAGKEGGTAIINGAAGSVQILRSRTSKSSAEVSGPVAATDILAHSTISSKVLMANTVNSSNASVARTMTSLRELITPKIAPTAHKIVLGNGLPFSLAVASESAGIAVTLGVHAARGTSGRSGEYLVLRAGNGLESGSIKLSANENAMATINRTSAVFGLPVSTEKDIHSSSVYTQFRLLVNELQAAAAVVSKHIDVNDITMPSLQSSTQQIDLGGDANYTVQPLSRTNASAAAISFTIQGQDSMHSMGGHLVLQTAPSSSIALRVQDTGMTFSSAGTRIQGRMLFGTSDASSLIIGGANVMSKPTTVRVRAQASQFGPGGGLKIKGGGTAGKKYGAIVIDAGMNRGNSHSGEVHLGTESGAVAIGNSNCTTNIGGNSEFTDTIFCYGNVTLGSNSSGVPCPPIITVSPPRKPKPAF